jgi:hypothetical protein
MWRGKDEVCNTSVEKQKQQSVGGQCLRHNLPIPRFWGLNRSAGD